MEDDNDDENGDDDDDEYQNYHISTNFQARISRFCSFFIMAHLIKIAIKLS